MNFAASIKEKNKQDARRSNRPFFQRIGEGLDYRNAVFGFKWNWRKGFPEDTYLAFGFCPTRRHGMKISAQYSSDPHAKGLMFTVSFF